MEARPGALFELVLGGFRQSWCYPEKQAHVDNERNLTDTWKTPFGH